MSVRSIFLVFLLTLVSATTARADTSSLVKLAADGSGYVEIPIQGTDDTYWMLLNECVLVREGKANAGEKVTYRPQGGYGDIFFFQQFAGDEEEFAETLIYLRLIENTMQCWEKEDLKKNRQTMSRNKNSQR